MYYISFDNDLSCLKDCELKFMDKELSFVDGIKNKAIYLDGKGYIYANINNPFKKDFTISFWYKYIDGKKGHCIIDSEKDMYFGLMLLWDDYEIRWSIGNSTNWQEEFGPARTNEITDGNWHHIVIRKTNKTYDFFIDNKNRYTYTAKNTDYDKDMNFKIGIWGNNYYDTNCYLDEMFIFERALTDEEIEKLYKLEYSSFGIKEKGILAYYPLDGNVKDYSGNGYDGKWSKNDQYDTGKFGKAAKFIEKDYSQFIELPLSLKDELLDSDFTISLWFNPAETMKQNGNQQYMSIIQFAKCNSCGCSGTWLKLIGKNNEREAPYILVLDINDPGNDKKNGVSIKIDNVQINANEWYNVIFSNKYIYINGKKVTNINDKKMTGNINRIRIGNNYCVCNSNDPCHSSHKYNGLIDEVYIFNKVLSEDEIEKLYKLDYSNFENDSEIFSNINFTYITSTNKNINLDCNVFISDIVYFDYKKEDIQNNFEVSIPSGYNFADVFVEADSINYNGKEYKDFCFFLKCKNGDKFEFQNLKKGIIVYTKDYWKYNKTRVYNG